MSDLTELFNVMSASEYGKLAVEEHRLRQQEQRKTQFIPDNTSAALERIYRCWDQVAPGRARLDIRKMIVG